MPLFWYTDRTRYELGIEYCPRRRFHEFHDGPTGYGIRPVSERVPLATGALVARGVEALNLYVKDHDQAPPEDVVRQIVADQTDVYDTLLRERGLAYFEDDLGLLIQEQHALIRGLLWCWALDRLPQLLQTERIIHVEAEHGLVLPGTCTCGQPDSVTLAALHAASCEGVCLNTRGDFVTEHRYAAGTYTYHEDKTVGQASDLWADKWETAMQVSVGTIGLEEALGITISQVFIEGHVKGARRRAYDKATKRYEGPEYQQSILCYGYRREALPPMQDEEWAAKYEWIDESGATRRLPKGFERAPAWEFPEGHEAWVRGLTSAERAECHRLVGPLEVKDAIRGGILRQIAAEEQRWQQTLWQLYEVATACGAGYRSHPDYLKALDQLVPQSWACRRYGKRHQCWAVPICFRHEGWEDPQGRLGMTDRVPHHVPELQQAIARGLIADPMGGLELDIEE